MGHGMLEDPSPKLGAMLVQQQQQQTISTKSAKIKSQNIGKTFHIHQIIRKFILSHRFINKPKKKNLGRR